MPPEPPAVREEPTPVATLMAGMAAGDPSCVFALLEQHRRPLVGTVRSILAELNRPDLADDAELVDALVIDAALVLFELAPGWRPGGAAPWRWGHRAIRAAVVAEIGHPSVEVDGDGPAAAPDSPVAQVDFDTLAGSHPAIATYLARVGRVASGRNRDVFVEYEIQQACGDPSPAHTVAELFGLSPANVRQIVSRTRRALETEGAMTQGTDAAVADVAVAELRSFDDRAAPLPRPGALLPPPAAALPPPAATPALAPPAAAPVSAAPQAPVVTRATWRRRVRALLRLALDHG